MSYLTFDEVLSQKKVFDASGIEQPSEWLWDCPDEVVEVYYPIKKHPYSELFTTGEVHGFFGGEIPNDWKIAIEQAKEEKVMFSRDLYLSALQEQENP